MSLGKAHEDTLEIFRLTTHVGEADLLIHEDSKDGVEILLLASRSGYRIRCIPVEWRDDPDSRFKPVSGMARNLGELARIRWMHR